MVECVFCDGRFAQTQSLCQHLIGHHAGTKVEGQSLFLSRNHRKTVHCWCGVFFALGPRAAAFVDEESGRWAKHLERRGGLAAHLLEIALGVSHDKRQH